MIPYPTAKVNKKRAQTSIVYKRKSWKKQWKASAKSLRKKNAAENNQTAILGGII